MSANVYQLRPDRLPQDMRKCAAEIHREARAGTITGIAFVCYMSDGSYIANAAGEAIVNRPVTRGFLLDLLDKLRVGGGGAL